MDIHEDTLNLDERLIEAAITSRTKAIAPVHYAGVACEMDTILDIAKRHRLKVVEDAAQGVMSNYKGRALGSIGDLGCYSFHETKNIISGEGGALLVNVEELASLAEIIREKGTDRSRFLRGEVDKYTWHEAGSSFLPSELIAAYLAAQLEEAEKITAMRLAHWDFYHAALADIEAEGALRRPIIPAHCQHNAHMYYVLLSPKANRDKVLAEMENKGVSARGHYVPLHSSPAGKRYTRVSGTMKRTDNLSARLIRLPLWAGLSKEDLARTIETLKSAIV